MYKCSSDPAAPKEDKVLKLPWSPVDGLAHSGMGPVARQG